MFFKKKTQKPLLPVWDRENYQPSSKPQVFFAVYGDFDESAFDVSRSQYECDGIPEGIEVHIYEGEKLQEMMWPFTDEPLKHVLEKDSKNLCDAARKAKACVVLRGEVKNDENLNYLRDITGFITSLCDKGGICVLCIDTFSIYSGAEWKEDFFHKKGEALHKHVIILKSAEDNGQFWVHTRGLLKFGRPDLSLFNVSEVDLVATHELFNRLIGWQINGGVIAEGQGIKMAGVDTGLKCYHQGDMEDPDFNNVHVEIR